MNARTCRGVGVLALLTAAACGSPRVDLDVVRADASSEIFDAAFTDNTVPPADNDRIDVIAADLGAPDIAINESGIRDVALTDTGPSSSLAIGEWTDGPGVCPVGIPRVDLHTAAELESATRGEGAYASDAPATCYFLHNGTYRQGASLLMFVRRGGTAAARRVFVGESRAGVRIIGRATVDDAINEVTLANLTFDLTGYSQSGSFNTVSLGTGNNVTLDRVTLTGDCNTGLRGGHVETNGTSGMLLDSCLLERFGHCGPTGHEDHGIYLASGRGLTIRNSVIRGNASRGIQLYTANGAYGTLADVTIERNRIYDNGHADYEDGIVINCAGTGTLTGLVVRQNLIYRNRYSGIRFAGAATTGISIERNTFAANGLGSTAASRSEINIDDVGTAAGATIGHNIFAAGNTLINDCRDATAHAFALRDNVVLGTVVTGAAGNCVTATVMADPAFVNAAGGDFHAENSAVSGYGAYAP